MTSTPVLADAFFRAANAAQDASNAVKAKDTECAKPLLFEALSLTCDAISMAAKAGSLESIENVASGVVLFVLALQGVGKGDFASADVLGDTDPPKKSAEPSPEPSLVRFRCSLGETMTKDERYTWAAAFATTFAVGDVTGAEAANAADCTIDALRAEMVARSAR